MARVELEPIIVPRASAETAVAARTLSSARSGIVGVDTGVWIDFFDSAQNNQGGRLILMFSASTGFSDAADTIPVAFKIMASTNPGNVYTAGGQGDMIIDMLRTTKAMFGATAGTVGEPHAIIVGPIETARFLDTDNRINIEGSTAGSTGATLAVCTNGAFVKAIVVP